MEIALLPQRGPLLIEPRWRLPYYTRHTLPDRPPQTGPTQLIKPKCTEPYYTKGPPPPDQPQMDFTLIHQTDLLLIDPDGDCPFTQDILWADQTPETDPT